ncbi:MAG: FTR1 family protein [Dialister micraerophilus]|nr:FTR1 family protein [Dialister micraerophilus]
MCDVIKKLLFTVCFILSLLMLPFSARASQDWEQIYDHIDSMIHTSVEQYASGDLEGSKKTVNDTYYGVYEKDGLEKAIRSTIASKNANLTEYQFSKLKKAIREDQGEASVKSEAETLLTMIKSDVITLENKNVAGGRWASFFTSLLLLLREGMEAILMLVAIIAYLQKSGNTKYMGTVYNYAIGAVVASFITAYIFSELMDKFAAGANQELIEGITGLVAVCVLLSVSIWMSGKSEAREWKKYIENMINHSITSKHARALGIAAFLAVYREGAEVILFYQALFNNSSGDTEMIWFGFGTGCILLLIIFAVIRKGLVRIPLRPFFIVTSLLMFIMAVAFAGGGVSELQEAGIIPQSVIAWEYFPNADWLGLYPTYETVGIQIVILLSGLITHFVRKRRNKNI